MTSDMPLYEGPLTYKIYRRSGTTGLPIIKSLRGGGGSLLDKETSKMYSREALDVLLLKNCEVRHLSPRTHSLLGRTYCTLNTGHGSTDGRCIINSS